MKLERNVTCKVTDAGNFNALVKSWYDSDGNPLCEVMTLEVDDVVNIKEYDEPTVPGGKHTILSKAVAGGVAVKTTVLGKLLFDREDVYYSMKADRHRIQVSNVL